MRLVRTHHVPRLGPRLHHVLMGLVVLALSIGGAQALACVPMPYVLVQPRASGPPGTTVDVVGSNFETEVTEVRWNALDGALLAKASGPSFSASITIPDDPEGLYTVLAVSRGAQGEVLDVARTPFAVTSASPGAQEAAAPIQSPAEPSSPSPVPPMLVGAGLVAVAGAGGALVARRRPAPADRRSSS